MMYRSFYQSKFTNSVSKTTVLSFILFPTLIISILYNSGYALITVDITIGIIFLCVGTVLSVIAALIKVNKFNISNIYITSYLLIPIGLLLAITFTMISNFEYNTWGSYFRQSIVIIYAFTITIIFPFKKFLELYLTIMRAMTVVTLCYSFMVNILKVNIPFPILTNTNNVSYYVGLIVFSQLHSPERSMGIFWEPGIYASFLILGLVCEFLFADRKINKVNVLLFIIAIITTFSTAGYILLLFVMLIALNERLDTSLSPILNISCILLLVIGLLFSEQTVIGLSKIMPSVFSKMTYESNPLITRINGPLADLKIFMNNPLFGAGIRDYQSLWRDTAYQFGLNSRTSTITYFLATIGVAGFLYAFAVIKGVCKLPGVKIVSKICLAIILISILTKEPHYYNVLMFVFIFYFLQKAAGDQLGHMIEQ